MTSTTYERTLEGGDSLANALGLFSLALGVAQVTAPRKVANLIGIQDTKRNRDTMLAIGLVAGVLAVDLLASRRAGERDRRVIGNGREREAESRHIVRSITVGRPRDEVYAYWRNLENLPRFMKHLESVEVLDARHSHWRAKAPAGHTVEWTAETVTDRPDLLAWRSLPGASVPNSGQVRFVDAAGDRGTEVHLELHYDPPAGKLGVTVAKLFGEEPAQQVADDLRRFKQVLEVGEVLHSDASIHRGMHPAQPPEERQPLRGDSEPAILSAGSREAAAQSSNAAETV